MIIDSKKLISIDIKILLLLVLIPSKTKASCMSANTTHISTDIPSRLEEVNTDITCGNNATGFKKIKIESIPLKNFVSVKT
tara:strand:- start:677 stop:919 length:243 start_codon:yes stop_codon:yes gene_type:complete